ncbi:hypothetical protein [Paenibacillus cookii]|nr:hypothetical protein [Paenibacillus cookii]
MSIYLRVDRSYISELEDGEKAPSLLTITAQWQGCFRLSLRY